MKTGVSCKEYFERGWGRGRRGWIDRRLRRKDGTGPRSAHEIPWNCIFLSDEDSAADDLNIKDRLLFFTHVDSSTGISTRSGRPRVKQSYRWFLDSGSPFPSLLPPSKNGRNESDTGGQRSKRSPSFGPTIFQFSKSNYLNDPTQWRSPPAGQRGYFIKTWNPIQKRRRR